MWQFSLSAVLRALGIWFFFLLCWRWVFSFKFCDVHTKFFPFPRSTRKNKKSIWWGHSFSTIHVHILCLHTLVMACEPASLAFITPALHSFLTTIPILYQSRSLRRILVKKKKRTCQNTVEKATWDKNWNLWYLAVWPLSEQGKWSGGCSSW